MLNWTEPIKKNNWRPSARFRESQFVQIASRTKTFLREVGYPYLPTTMSHDCHSSIVLFLKEAFPEKKSCFAYSIHILLLLLLLLLLLHPPRSNSWKVLSSDKLYSALYSLHEKVTTTIGYCHKKKWNVYAADRKMFHFFLSRSTQSIRYVWLLIRFVTFSSKGRSRIEFNILFQKKMRRMTRFWANKKTSLTVLGLEQKLFCEK